MLLLAHLLTQNLDWRNHQIRLLRVIPSEEGRSDVERHLSELASQARIEVTTRAIVSDNPAAAIQDVSKRAAVVLLGLGTPEAGAETEYCQRMDRLVGGLRTVFFVESIGDMSLES